MQLHRPDRLLRRPKIARPQLVRADNPAEGLAAHLEVSPTVEQLVGPGQLNEWALNYSRTHALRCRWDAQIVEQLIADRAASGRVLNVGGLPYLFEYFLSSATKAEIVSLDLDTGRAAGVESLLGITALSADIEDADLQLDSEAFDCVVLAEVFEHLRLDLLGTIGRLAASVRPGGHLYITTPNGLSLNAFLRTLTRGRTGPNPAVQWKLLETLGHMGHVREYSMAEVREVLMLPEFGFSTVECMFRDRTQRTGRLGRLTRSISRSLSPSFADELVLIATKGPHEPGPS